MNNYPTSRRPEGTGGADDDDFRILPPAAVSAPPAVSRPPQPAWTPPPPPAPVPAPIPVVAPPRRRALTEAQQKWLIGIGAIVVILLAIGLFLFIVNSDSEGKATQSLIPTATAIAGADQPMALQACAALPKPTAVSDPDKSLVANVYRDCGLRLVHPNPPDLQTTAQDVVLAKGYFTQSLQLKPDDADVQLNYKLAEDYIKIDSLKANRGAYLGKLWEFLEAKDANDKYVLQQAYADAFEQYYATAVDDGFDKLNLGYCDWAITQRFELAVRTRFVDTSRAQSLLQEAKKRLVETPNTCKAFITP